MLKIVNFNQSIHLVIERLVIHILNTIQLKTAVKGKKYENTFLKDNITNIHVLFNVMKNKMQKLCTCMLNSVERKQCKGDWWDGQS